ncbi:RagB/SusD family nutrient uptake outer membrane protein [Sphingobacterium phlebotomi]|uniref:RagB/SusD family nutrient uptake outer membrane protein n=1 Tax=Sphingobacterium phlebotomi TaxID=2605433 RepID=A0A5D4HCI6_9SPHI|nr:RagB/SusD family nutrient uptake outer membrane protein [Sphingobacterium phlebotomi]TYR37529.1 RagB/SusD family nutrient uptake outer membrane protein [Sphingobacterium phlebotomi]
MLKKIKYIGLSVFLMSTTSCSKLLDLEPSGYEMLAEGYYTTESELNYALNGVYANLADSYLYGNNMLGRMGLEADEAYEDYSSDENSVGDYNTEATDTKILNYWRACYTGINRANTLLANIDNDEIAIDQVKRNDIKGQTLFLRGYYYFMLVTRFQGVPLILKPIQSARAEALQQERATGREVYAQIVRDMEQAADLVRPAAEVSTGGRVSKSAVWGMLARVNLYLAGYPYNERERYQDAMVYAGRVINEDFHALNSSYEQIFINYAQDKYDIRESIFEVEFHSDGTAVYPTAGMVGRNNGIRNPVIDDVIGLSIGVLRSTDYLHGLYVSSDLRQEWNVAPFYYVNTNGVATITYWVPTDSKYQRFCGKFRREYETVTPKLQSQTPQNFPLLRYSDVLLMYAEAYNEYFNGADDNAVEYLNMVRRRGLGLDPTIASPATDFTDRSYEAFQREVRDERPRELCFEMLRKNDIVRWGVFYDNMLTREAETPQTFTSSYYVRARRYFRSVERKDQWWPIPAYELGVNKKLVQNQGW